MALARPLRIGIVVPGYSETGLPAVVDVVTALARDHDVRVIAVRHPPTRDPFRLHGVDVHPVGVGNAGGARVRSHVLIRGVESVVALHRARPFDVIHALWADEPGAVAVLAGAVLRRPTVISVLGGELTAIPDIGYGGALGRGGRWTAAVALRRADVVTVGSSTVHEMLSARAAGDRVRLVPLGVDLDAFLPAPETRAGDELVLHVGSLEPVKDQVALLRAFARVARDRPAARLEICGDGRMRRPLDRLARTLGIAERVSFRGAVPRAQLSERYRSAAVLAVSSRWEAQSMAAVEAVACGLPVVGTRVGCLPDLGAAGVCVPVGDHRALAAALDEVLGDGSGMAAMRVAARSAAEATYGLDRAVAGMVGAYRAAIDAS